MDPINKNINIFLVKDNSNSLLLVKYTSSLKFQRNTYISFVPHELCNKSEFTIIVFELISSAHNWS